MSLHNLAKEIQKKGRGDDRMLVHMTPGEVHGLQALAKAHGGSLTINPDTGLVEAGFLKNLLPMVAGAALTYFSGGTLAPWASGLMVGGFEAARTGDVGKGLMAGLGAYGGAGIGAGLSSAGAASVADAGGSAAVEGLGSQGTSLTADQMANLSPEQLQGLQNASQSGAYNTADVLKTANAQNQFNAANNMLGADKFSNLNAGQLQGYQTALESGQYAPADVMRSAGAQNAVQGSSNMGNLSAGIKGLSTEAGRSAAYEAIPSFALPAAGMSTVAAAADAANERNQPIDTTKELDEKYKRAPYSYSLSPDFKPGIPTPPSPAYTPRGLGYGGYAAGGLAAGGSFDDEYGKDEYAQGGDVKKKRATYTSASKEAAMDPYQAGIAGLNNARYMANMSGDFAIPTRMQELGDIPLRAAQGRYLKGDGDGMSDSIPATINGRQPARLADGEFVVPADVVSHIGNGSSDAGAKKLYKMMDKVRVARTGKKKQAPEVKTDKYMPA